MISMSEVFAVCHPVCVGIYGTPVLAPSRRADVKYLSSRHESQSHECRVRSCARGASPLARGGAQSAVLLVWSLKHHKAWPWTVVKSMNSFFKVYIMNYTREVPSCDKSVMSCCCRPPRPGE